jgi:gliding motility-associated-like protein
MIKTTFDLKYLKIFLFLFFLPFFNTTTYAQCAGDDNSITICDKETYNQGIGNPIGVLNLYSLLLGTPTPGGTWTDLNSSGGLNTITGLLNTWQINQGGVYNYRYIVTGVPGCVDSISFITLTLGGFPGVDNPNAVACSDDSSVNLFSFLGSNPNPHFSGTWTGPPGTVSGNIFNAQLAGAGTFILTYTVVAVGTCPSRKADVTVTVHPLPIAGTPIPMIFCETDDFSTFTNIDLFDQLTGEDGGGTWADANATGELSGPGDSFINIQNIATNFGPGIYNFTYTVNPSHPICNPATANVSITIKPVVDLNGATLAVAPNICFNEIPTTPIIGTITQGATPIPDGTYNITYVLGGANTGTATIPVTFAGGVATFTVNPAFLTAVGTTTVDITTVLDPSTFPTNCIRVISNLNNTFIINENPNISDSQLNIGDICLGQTGQAQISDINGPTIQLSDGTYTVTFNITGPSGTATGQTASVTITGGTGIFNVLSALTPIDGNYSVTITNITNTATNCSTIANLTDSFVVSPIPDAVSIAVAIPDICDGDPAGITVNISGASSLTNGLYNITYDISGAINTTGQVATNVLFTSGSGSFTLPPAVILNIGVSTLTIANLLNSTSTCQTTTFTNPSGTFEIHAIPDASDINITVADVCLGQSGILNIFDINLGVAPELTNGAYTITYDITGANVATGQTAIVNINSGSPLGTFIIPASQLTNIGSTTISILFITNNTTGCDALGVPIITTFDVLEIPIIDNVSLTVSQPICQGQGTVASITGAAVNDGNFDLTYNITGVNTVTGQTVSVVFASGNTTFNIPSTQIPNIGNNTITITNIVDNNTPNACTSPVTNVTANFTVSENPDTTNTILTALDPVCLGSAGQVTLTDITSTLSDGNYNVVYNLSGTNTASNITANVTISSGTGSFSVLSSLLTNLGNTTVTITSIANSSTNCSSVANLIIDFDIIPLPDTTGTTVTVTEPICLGGDATVQINGPALTDGTYTLTYDLSGANSSTGNATTVGIIASNGQFTIPSTLLTNAGGTTVTLNLQTNTTTGCTVQGGSVSDSFTVSPIPAINVSEINILDICIGNNATVSINSLGGLIDGNYQLGYTISGANGPSSQTVLFTVAGGIGTFNISNTLLTNSGLTTISFSSITNLDTTCSSPLNLNVNFMVNPLPDVNPNQFSIADICLGQNGTGIITNATNLVDSNYTIIYNLTGTNIANNQSATVTMATGDGSFVIPSALLTNIGTTNVTIISITNDTTGCTTSPIIISTNFVINPIPDTTGTTVTVTEPICLGGDATVQINGSALTDGTYTLTYDLSGVNSSTGNAVTVGIIASNGQFTIPNTLLTNAGNTTVTLTLQTNTTTGCTVQGGSVSDSFTVSPIPAINISEINILDICIDNSATVSINSLGGLIDGNYQLNYTISGANGPSSQTVLFTVAGGVGTFNISNTLLTNSGSTTISFSSVTNLDTTCSSPLNLNVNFMVNPLPDVNPNQFNITDICLGQNGSGIITNATNLVDSNYTILYNLTGANTANNQSATVAIATGGGSFVIPSALLINTGVTSVTIISITNNTTGCTTSPIAIGANFVINPIPDTTGITIDPIAPVCSGSGTTATISSTTLIDGTYNVSYEITNNVNTNIVTGNTSIVITGGVNTSPPFIIQASDINVVANYTISITTITNPTTLCPGTSSSITQSFVVNPMPALLASEVTIADICIGNNADVYITSLSGLIAGNYQLDYTISNINGTSPIQTVAFTVPGSPAFSIPNVLLTPAGPTSIHFSSITNLDTTCSSSLSFPVSFMVNPLPTVNPGEMSVLDACLGQDAVGMITAAANLANGNYSITYDLTGQNTAINLTATTSINSGGGLFNILGADLPNFGLTTITITGITNTLTGCSTSGLTIGYTFTVNPLPNVAGANVDVTNNPICINSPVTVNIINATALSTVFPYTVIYNLSGANTSTNNPVSLTFDALGSASFVIPVTLLPNGGSTTVTIQDLIYSLTSCGANTVTLNQETFTITDPQTPTLNTDGNLFCIQDSPTVGDLNANAVASGTITWYDSPTGGNAYNATDLLFHGNTYYATSTDASGCISSVRLQVTVDLTSCDNLFIPDGFSPNGDGLNEEFYIKDIALLYPKFELEIYNRYGNMVYKGNINTPNFNGKANQTTLVGKEILPTGVYFYIIYFNDADNTEPKQGRLYLSR